MLLRCQLSGLVERRLVEALSVVGDLVWFVFLGFVSSRSLRRGVLVGGYYYLIILLYRFTRLWRVLDSLLLIWVFLYFQ